MIKHKKIVQFASATLISLIALFSLAGTTVFAAQLIEVSLDLQPTTGSNGYLPGAVSNDNFGFTSSTTGNIGSIQFLYCTTPTGTCTTPAGLNTTAATVGYQVGATGFTIVNTTNGAPYLTRTLSSIASGTALMYQLRGVTNPTTSNQTFYVRISTYRSTNATGTYLDSGIASATTYAPIAGTLEAENMKLPAGSNIIEDLTASNKEAVQMTKNASLKGTVNLSSAATALSVNVEASSCGVQDPKFKVDVDGVNVITRAAVAPTFGYTRLTASNLNLASGAHMLTLTASNLGYNTVCNRPIVVDVTNFYD
ncbi:MAG: hypothetical protein ACHQT9_02720 [Candidatus Saccharimonadales bacterium]